MKDQSHNIPFQVQSLIDSMMSKGEIQHVRDNYRNRLESIRDAIDLSLKKYKTEEIMNHNRKRA